MDAAAQRGVGVYGVAPYRMSRSGDQGLIFGYAGLEEAAIIEGVELLTHVIAAVAIAAMTRRPTRRGPMGSPADAVARPLLPCIPLYFAVVALQHGVAVAVVARVVSLAPQVADCVARSALGICEPALDLRLG